ncbi:hypothetical protein DY036_07040 [Apilactobacillus kunkeei]|nr:hypothetical protein DY036_07040 [Apilactobacillus kunkeei]
MTISEIIRWFVLGSISILFISIVFNLIKDLVEDIILKFYSYKYEYYSQTKKDKKGGDDNDK